MNANQIAQVAQHLNVSPNQIKRCEEWATVLFVVVHGCRPRFVSKKAVKMSKYFVYQAEQLVELQEASTDERAFSLSDQLQNWDGRVQCCDCKNWVWGSEASLGRGIRHSSRCSTPNAQPVSTYKKPTLPQPIKKADKADVDLQKAARDHKASYNVDSDTVFDAYKAGYLSMSDAMNSDF